MSAVFGCCVDRQYGKGCTDATCMKLPEGKTCGSCALFPRCKAFGISTKPDRADCDFFPRKYRELPVVP